MTYSRLSASSGQITKEWSEENRDEGKDWSGSEIGERIVVRVEDHEMSVTFLGLNRSKVGPKGKPRV